MKKRRRNAVRREKERRQGGLGERPGWCLSQPADGMAMHCRNSNATTEYIMGTTEKNRSLYAEETAMEVFYITE